MTLAGDLASVRDAVVELQSKQSELVESYNLLLMKLRQNLTNDDIGKGLEDVAKSE